MSQKRGDTVVIHNPMEDSRTMVTCRTCGGRLDPELPGAACPRCLAAAFSEESPPPFASEAGFSVAGYQIDGVLGRGGMGVVYRARQEHPKREVALKMLLPAILESDDMRVRFLTEVQALASLNHEGILPLYQFGEHEARPFFTTLLATGGSLAQRLKDGRGSANARAAAEMLVLLADAIQYAHDHGVLHRDLKPSNILFDAADRPLVADFGLARVAGADGAISHAVIMGTPNYLAPEVVASGACAATSATDVYGLGAVFYELLSGRPPFESTSVPDLLRSISEKEPAPAVPAEGSARPTPPRDLQIICHKCLAKEPAKRYASASALADDLRRWLRGEPILARPASPTERLVSWARRNPAMAALYVLLTAVLVAAITAQTLALKKSRRLESEARAARLDAEEQIGFALGDYADRVEAMGRYELLNDSFANIRRYYERLPQTQMDEAAKLTKAKFLVREAAARQAQGNLSGAEASLHEALKLLPRSEAATAAAAHRILAAVMQQTDREEAAAAEFDIAISISAAAPSDPMAVVEHATALLRRAEQRGRDRDFTGAYADLDNAHSVLERLPAVAPPDSTMHRSVVFLRIMAMQHRSAILKEEYEQTRPATTTRLDQAMQGIADFTRGIAALPAEPGRDTLRYRALAEAAEWRGVLLLVYGENRLVEAITELDKASGMFANLVTEDGLDIRAWNSLAMTHRWRARVFRALKDPASEWNAREKARIHYEECLRRAPLSFSLLSSCGDLIVETVQAVADKEPKIPKPPEALSPYLDLHLELAKSAGQREHAWRLTGELVRRVARAVVKKDDPDVAGASQRIAAGLAILDHWLLRITEIKDQPLTALAEAALWRGKADILTDAGRGAEALEPSRRAVSLRAELLHKALAPADISGATAGAYQKLHGLLDRENLADELESSARAALSDAPLVRNLTPLPKGWRGNWAGMFAEAAEALTAAGRAPQALALARQALPLLYEEDPPVPFTESENDARARLETAAYPDGKPLQ